MNYLNENELSFRSLDEFLIIFGLRLHLKFARINELRKSVKTMLDNEPTAPPYLMEGETLNLYHSLVNARIDTENDLISWLSNKSNLSFFAKTRNSYYFALFSSFNWSEYAPSQWKSAVPTHDKVIELFEGYLERKIHLPLSMKDDFYHLFGLHSLDDDGIPKENYLNESEISQLSKIYDDTFMTYPTYCSLVQRTRPIDITSGTYLIRILEEMDPDSSCDDVFDYTQIDKFVAHCNSYLYGAGLSSLSPELNPFHALVLDVYKEAVTETPKNDSHNINYLIKASFFAKLRSYLKQIAESIQ